MSYFSTIDKKKALALLQRRCDKVKNMHNRKLLQDYLRIRRLGNVAKMSTLGQDANDVSKFLISLGPVNVEDATQEHVLDFMDSLADLQDSTQHKAYTVTRAFHRRALKLSKNEVPDAWKDVPCKRSRDTRVKKEDLFTVDEFEAMLRHADNQQERALLYVVYETGVRASCSASTSARSSPMPMGPSCPGPMWKV